MKAAIQFEAEARESFGKGVTRALRRENKVPAIVYGLGKEPRSFTILEKDIQREYRKGGFYGKLVEIKLGKETITVLPKQLQLHPVSDRIQHVDFTNVSKDQDITVFIPVKFRGMERCVGIKRGGNLNVIRRELELLCNPANIPTIIEIDITDINIGDSVHISSVTLPEGVRPTIDRDYTIAAVAGRTSKEAREEDQETAEEEGVEGEEAKGEDAAE